MSIHCMSFAVNKFLSIIKKKYHTGCGEKPGVRELTTYLLAAADQEGCSTCGRQQSRAQPPSV